MSCSSTNNHTQIFSLGATPMYCKDDLLAYRMAPSKRRASPRLRAACDRCYQAKVNCSYNEGSVSCIRCQKRDGPCIRSPSLSQGRPKGRTPTVFKAKHSSSPGSSSTSSHGAPSSRPSTGREDQAGQSLSCMDSSTPPFEDVQVPMDLALAEPTDFSGLALDWPGIGTLHAPLPESGMQITHYGDTGSSLPSACSCFAAITKASRDLQCSPVGGSLLSYALRLNKDALAVIGDFLACWLPHGKPVVLLAYFFVNQIAATYAKAWVTEYGSDAMNARDRSAHHRIIVLDVQKLAPLLELLREKAQRRHGRVALGDNDDDYGPTCSFVHNLVKTEVDCIIEGTQEQY